MKYSLEQRVRLRRPDGAGDLSVVHSKDGAAVLAGCSMFRGISSGIYARTLAAARIKKFEPGDVLYVDDDPVREVFLVTSGIVKVMKSSASGTTVILRFGVPGDVLGAAHLVLSGRHSTTAEPSRQCLALVWRAFDFKAIMEDCPLLYQNMLKVQHEELAEAEERFSEMATERLVPRVARQLLRLHGKLSRFDSGMVELNISREELAQMTGATVWTISRLLVEWEACGMVRSRRGAVTICDVPLLWAQCDSCLPAREAKGCVQEARRKTGGGARTLDAAGGSFAGVPGTAL